MNLVTAVTATGPVLGIVGWAAGWPWLFWVGVVVCALTLVLNMLSGAMKLPVLPLAFMAFGSGFGSPWWLGVAMGLVAWTALEALLEIATQLRTAPRPPAP